MWSVPLCEVRWCSAWWWGGFGWLLLHITLGDRGEVGHESGAGFLGEASLGDDVAAGFFDGGSFDFGVRPGVDLRGGDGGVSEQVTEALCEASHNAFAQNR